MLAFADAKCYTTTHQQLLRDRSRIHVICCWIQFGDSSILMATRAFRVVPGHRQIGESHWTSVTLPELKRNQLGMKVQHSWLNSILLKQWGSNACLLSVSPTTGIPASSGHYANPAIPSWFPEWPAPRGYEVCVYWLCNTIEPSQYIHLPLMDHS